MKVKTLEINWGDRARKDYGGPEEIAKLNSSLERIGLLHPIVIDDSYELRAGGRRLLSAIQLGWTEIECTMFSDLSPLQKKEIELEENIQRKNFSFAEEVSLTDQVHELKKEIAEKEGKEWTTEDTAKDLGLSTITVYQDIELAKAIKVDPSLAEVKNKGIAKTKARRARKIKGMRASQVETLATLEESSVKELYHSPCEAILAILPSNSVDLILFDPPYAVDFENNRRAEGHVGTYGDDYKDDVISLNSLLSDTLMELHRILKPGGHMYLFYAMINHSNITTMVDRLFRPIGTGDDGKIKSGKYSKNPLFWVKPSNDNPRPYERFTINYEPFLFCWKRKEKSELGNELQRVSNSTFHFPFMGIDKVHPAEKPIELYESLIGISTIEGGVVLDPTAGTGKSLKAAKRMNRKIIGIEREKEWFEVMQFNVANFDKED